MHPKNFTILGERSSGTEILKQFILDNFDIPYTQYFGSTHSDYEFLIYESDKIGIWFLHLFSFQTPI